MLWHNCSIVLGWQQKSHRRDYKTPNLSVSEMRWMNLTCFCLNLKRFFELVFYDPSSASFTLPPSFCWSAAAPSLSECNLALGGSCRLNCDPLMTLQLYPSAYTYPQLKMLVIVMDRLKIKKQPRVHGILVGYKPEYHMFHRIKQVNKCNFQVRVKCSRWLISAKSLGWLVKSLQHLLLF